MCTGRPTHDGSGSTKAHANVGRGAPEKVACLLPELRRGLLDYNTLGCSCTVWYGTVHDNNRAAATRTEGAADFVTSGHIGCKEGAHVLHAVSEYDRGSYRRSFGSCLSFAQATSCGRTQTLGRLTPLVLLGVVLGDKINQTQCAHIHKDVCFHFSTKSELVAEEESR